MGLKLGQQRPRRLVVRRERRDCGGFKLSDDVELVPFDDLPYSTGKSFFDAKFARLGEPMRTSPTAAIVWTIPHEPWFLTEAERVAEGNDINQGLLLKHSERIQKASDIVRCLTLLGPAAPRTVGSWVDCDSPLIPTIGISYHPEALVITRSVREVVIVGDEIKNLVNKFAALREDIRNGLAISIDRLNESLRQAKLEDGAIDLGICLEAVLMHDIGDTRDNQPINFRLALRGAFLLHKDAAERLAAFNLLRTVYDLRSAAIHSGKLPKQCDMRGGGKAKPADVLNSGTELAARIIRAIVDVGRWPVWEKEFVFGVIDRADSARPA